MPGTNGSTFSTQNAASTVGSNSTVLSANSARIAFSIQNLQVNPLYIYFGTGADISSKFSYILKAGSGANDGTGGFLAMEAGAVYNGAITCAGTSPSYVVVEIAP